MSGSPSHNSCLSEFSMPSTFPIVVLFLLFVVELKSSPIAMICTAGRLPTGVSWATQCCVTPIFHDNCTTVDHITFSYGLSEPDFAAITVATPDGCSFSASATWSGSSDLYHVNADLTVGGKSIAQLVGNFSVTQ